MKHEELIRKMERKFDGKEFSGFFDLPIDKVCTSPEHDPPQHLHIPYGKGYRHRCPSCGKTQILIPPQITL